MVTRWIFFGRPVEVNQDFLYLRQNSFKFFSLFVQRKLNMKFLLASLKTLTNSKFSFKSCITFLFRLSLTFISRSFQWSFMAGFRNNYQESLGAFGTIYRITGGFWNNFYTGGYWKDKTSSLKGVTEQIITIVKWFQRSKQKLYIIVDFLQKQKAKKCENHHWLFIVLCRLLGS